MLSTLKKFAKMLARILLSDYAIYHIYSQAVWQEVALQSKVPAGFRCIGIDRQSIDASADPLIRDQAGYAGTGASAYACFDGERIVGICFYWFGERYLQRNFWPLKDGEAKLVQIITLPDMRGRGIARALIAGSSELMREKNFHRLYARIWHSNTPSLHAFERAGWRRVATVIEINPLRRSRAVRIRLEKRLITDRANDVAA